MRVGADIKPTNGGLPGNALLNGATRGRNRFPSVASINYWLFRGCCENNKTEKFHSFLQDEEIESLFIFQIQNMIHKKRP